MKTVGYIAKIALPLLLICAVIIAVLAAVNHVTAPVIADNMAKELDRNMTSFYGEGIKAETFEASGLDASVKAVYKVTKDNELVGYCFDVTGSGAYKGKIEVLVALDASGAVKGISNVRNDETPGKGDKVLNDEYFKLYNGHNASNIEKGKDITFVSGATKTSTALNNAVHNAVTAFEFISGECGVSYE